MDILISNASGEPIYTQITNQIKKMILDGTLKEGEITGLPYQYKDENGKTKFRFLPY